jgi:hypothetical protein
VILADVAGFPSCAWPLNLSASRNFVGPSPRTESRQAPRYNVEQNMLFVGPWLNFDYITSNLLF